MDSINQKFNNQSGFERFRASLFFKAVNWCLIFTMASLCFTLDSLAYRNDLYAAELPSVTQRKPIANAGHDQTLPLNSKVIVDGNGSVDPNGDQLQYHWRIKSKPKASNAQLQNADTVKPNFTIDKAGDYLVELVVDDGKLSSDPDTIRISTSNSTPVARAGRDQTVPKGKLAKLDGTGSSDIDGELLKYSWEIIQRPKGSTTRLENPNVVQPGFKPDMDGDYTVRLHVEDPKKNHHYCDVHVSTHDSPPIANAGPDQNVLLNQTINLDGSGSSDLDGSKLYYQWSFTSLPKGSKAKINRPSTVKPNFIADQLGTYIVQLTVGEEKECWKRRVGIKNQTDHDCATDTVVITTENRKPVADAGQDQAVRVNGQVHLDGTQSKDPDGTAITEYTWSFTSLPTNSFAALINNKAATQDFTADLAGSYILQLIVKSGGQSSEPDTVIINTENSKPVANAGPGQQAKQFDSVRLDGSGSSDPDRDPLAYSWALLSKPDGSIADIQPVNAISPSFTADLPGIYVPQLIVNDGKLDSDPATTSINVAALNRAPNIASSPLLVGQAGSSYNYAVAATDPDIGDVLSFALVTYPSGMAINTSTGLITWTPAANQTGAQAVTLQVKDQGGLTANQSYTIQVAQANRPPVITSTALTVATVGLAYSYDVNATDPDVGDTLTYSLTTLPTGMSINASTGVIAWTPAANQTGATALIVQVSDGHTGGTVNQSFSVLVSVAPPLNQPPVFTSTAVLAATVGQSYSYDVNATDPDVGDTLTYTLTTPINGMSINASTGAIAWTPAANQTGTQAVIVRVQDSGGLFVDQSFSVTVDIALPFNQPPVITTAAVTIATVGVAYTYDVDANDPDITDILSYTLTTPITGMTINPSTGLIAWTPAANQTGVQAVTVEVSDGHSGGTVTQSFNIQVGTAPPPNQPPVITTAAVTTAKVGQAYSYDVDASDPDVGDTLSYSLTAQPVDMTINASTGVITWTPAANQTGAQAVMLQVSDGHAGGIATQSFSIQVTVANTKSLACRARSDSYSTRADHALSVAVPGVLGNDIVSPGDFLTALKLTEPTRGALNFNSTGAFDYTPNASNQTCTAPPAAGISFVEPLGIPLGVASDALINIRGLAKGDFNHDGFLDLAVTGQFSFGWRISVVMGKGDGTFQPLVVLQTLNGDVRPSGILAKDVDDDCNLDLFVAVEFTKEVLFFKGHGDGSFDAALATVLTTTPQGLQSADLNNDGKLDLVTLNSNNGSPGNSVSVLLSNGIGTFQSPVTYPTNAGVTDLALGDVNGDGAPDMVVSSTTSSLSILLNTNNGSGTFAAAQQSPVNVSQMSGLFLADFNRDSKLDIVVGGFQCLWTGGNPSGLGTTGTGGCMTFIPGNGDGSFTAPQSIVPNLSPFTTAMAWFPSRGRYSENVAPDVNGDGILDVVFGELPEQAAGNLLHVRLGKGDGTFSTTAWVASAGQSVGAPPLTNLPDSVSGLGAAVIDDFTGDGVMDIATALGNANGIRSGRAALLVGTTPGKFASPGIFPVLEPPFSLGNFGGGGVLGFYPMTLGDFTNDGQPELAVVGGFNRLGLMPLASEGTLGSIKTGIALPAIDPGGIDPLNADFDRDGNLDVAFIGTNQQRGGSVYVVYGDGTGQFANPVEIRPTGNSGFQNIVGGDFNNDGFPDIAAYTGTNPVLIDLFLGTGASRTFTRFGSAGGGPLGDGSSGGFAMVAADFDQDGILDLVISKGFYLTNQPAPQQSIFLRGNGDGSFQPATVIAKDILSGFVDFAAADINHDNKLDLIGIAQYSAVLVQLGNGDGTFSAPIFYDTAFAGSAGQIVLADFDWDGHLDIALTMIGFLNTTYGLGVLRGLGDGTFAPIQRLAYGVTGRNASSLIAADVNNDGRPDLITGGPDSTAQDFTVLLNNSASLNSCTNTDSFTYKASDGTFDSLPMTVRIAIKPSNHPPLVISAPITTASSGQLYVYDVNASDQDAGERLAYALTKAPSGMTIEADTGVIKWRPAANQSGPQPVIVRVYDNNGVFAEQSFTLTVAQRVTIPNVVGQTQANAQTTITGAGLTVGTATSRYSPTVAVGSVISQTPAAGLSVAQNTAVNLVVSLGALTVPGLSTITVNPSTHTILVGSTQAFTATGVVSGGGAVDVTDGVTWGSAAPAVASVNSLGVATGIAAGTTSITATLGSISGTGNLTVRAALAGDSTFPTAVLSSPGDGAEVTSPVNIIGTATDDNFLRYELSYAPVGETNFTLLNSGSTAVSNGVLGQLDPTLLVNDLYTLKLTVFDLGGNQSEAIVTVQVARELKIGLFSISFQDINIPLSGIPITINRTYDSRDKGKGDFGIGWRLDIQTLRIRPNREQGTGWVVNKSGTVIPVYSLAPVGEHKVSLTLPGGKFEEFDLNINPSVSPVSLLSSVVASYTARPGTLGSLVSLDDNDLLVNGDQPGNVTLTNFNLDTFNPKRFRYTSADGTKIDIDRTKGVEKVQDLNGNSLTFGANGITHSSGKSVVFTRDAQGRITQITDPSGNVRSYAYNSSGDLISATDFVGKTTSFTYNNSHGLLDIIDPTGARVARNEYDANGRLISTTDANGKVVTFTHNLNTRQEVTTDRLGNVTVFEYDDVGNVVSKTDALGGRTNYTYDSNGNELTVTDPLGRVVTKTYDAANNVLSSTDVDGNTTINTYNARQQVLTTRDPEGQVTTNVYDANGNLTQVTNADGGVSQYTFDAAGNQLSGTDPLGNVGTSTYDSTGNQVTRIDPLNNVTTYVYDANNHQLSETDAAGNKTQYTYDAAGQVTKTTDPLGGTKLTTYDARGKKQSTTDANGNVTSYDYDTLGHLIQTTAPDGSTYSVTYDAEGREISQTNADGHTTSFGYDTLGRRILTTLPDGVTTATTYDAIGRTLTQTDPRGNVTTHSYGPNQQTVTNALGQATTELFDGDSKRTQMTDALGRVFLFSYDGRGNLTKTTFPDLTTKTTTYDPAGQKTAETDQAGLVTQFTYDVLGRLVKVTDAAAQITTYAYDNVGNQISQTDANGHKTQLQYDANGRLTQRTRPLGQQESFTYDAVGNQLTHTDFNGHTTSFSHSTVNQLIKKTLPGSSIVNYAFSANGLRTHAGADSYTYDVRGRLTQETKASGEVLSYTYDAAGNKTALTTPQGTTTYSYDPLNRLKTVVDSTGTTTYSYDAVGNLAATTFPNGNTTSNNYDTLNRLTQMQNNGASGLISSYTYTLGAAGNRLQVVEAGSATTGRTVAYTYDSVYRLTKETIDEPGTVNDQVITYTYDPVGNRTQMNRTGVVTTSSYDNNDRLLTETSSAGTFISTYDANGNLKTRGNGISTATYGYDGENRLVVSTNASGTVSYTYDADGMRTSKTAGGATTSFLLDKQREYAQVVTEKTGAALTTYSYGQQLISQTQTGVGTHFYLADGHLSTRQLTTSTGAVSDTYNYDAFGVALAATGITPNNYLYTGEQYDPNMGFYYLRARYYDQVNGRFVTTDPVLGSAFEPVTLHRYVYANANPVNIRDPSGESISLAAGIAVLTLTAVLLGAYSFLSSNFTSSKKAAEAVVFTNLKVSLVGIALSGREDPFTAEVENTITGIWKQAGITIIANYFATKVPKESYKEGLYLSRTNLTIIFFGKDTRKSSGENLGGGHGSIEVAQYGGRVFEDTANPATITDYGKSAAHLLGHCFGLSDSTEKNLMGVPPGDELNDSQASAARTYVNGLKNTRGICK